MNANDIGKIVRYFRKEKGLSQQKLAQLAGIGKTAVFDMEKGKTTIQLDTLLKALEVLNIRIQFKIPVKPAEQG